MLSLAMGNGCLHNHGDDYGEIGALATDEHITLTRADPSALGTRLAGNSSSVVPKLYRRWAWRFLEQLETVFVV